LMDVLVACDLCDIERHLRLSQCRRRESNEEPSHKRIDVHHVVLYRLRRKEAVSA